MERKQRQLWTVVLFALVAAALMVGTALADPTAPTQIDEGTPESRDLSTLTAQSVNASAGNVTEINLTALAITKAWQGFYGEVSGTIILQNANNWTFYDWNVTTPQGEVYATRAANPTWSGTDCLPTAGISTEETALGMSASDADSVSNTYDNTTSTHPEFEVAGATITAGDCYATNAYVNNASQTASFFQVLLADGASNIVYTTLINSSTTGFDGAAHDFQLLVGEDGHGAGAATATPYYFWVEIN